MVEETWPKSPGAVSRYKLILGYELVTVEETRPKPPGAVSRHKQKSKSLSSHGAEFNLRADEGVRVKLITEFLFDAETKCKKCDKSTYPYCPC